VPVAVPSLLRSSAPHAVVGREVEPSLRNHSVRLRTAGGHAGGEVGHGTGASRGSVAAPELSAVRCVEAGEVHASPSAVTSDSLGAPKV